jgi:hypothetical protein
MIEEWREIKDFPNYFISNLGRVKHNDRILKPYVIRGGGKKDIEYNEYLGIGIFKDDKRYRKKIHFLVASAFIPNPLNRILVNHQNLNKKDNQVSNLEWMTVKENTIHGIKMKKAFEENEMMEVEREKAYEKSEKERDTLR